MATKCQQVVCNDWDVSEWSVSGQWVVSEWSWRWNLRTVPVLVFQWPGCSAVGASSRAGPPLESAASARVPRCHRLCSSPTEIAKFKKLISEFHNWITIITSWRARYDGGQLVISSTCVGDLENVSIGKSPAAGLRPPAFQPPQTPPFTALLFRAVLEQFQSSFRVIAEHFQSTFRALSEQFWSSFKSISEQFQSNFRAVLEQFKSSFRTVSEQFQSTFRALLEQFQINFRAISEQFQINFRAISEQFQSNFRAVLEQFKSSFRTVSEQFQSSLGAVSEQFQSSFGALSEQFRISFKSASE